jgi:hypothetical protein
MVSATASAFRASNAMRRPIVFGQYHPLRSNHWVCVRIQRERLDNERLQFMSLPELPSLGVPRSILFELRTGTIIGLQRCGATLTVALNASVSPGMVNVGFPPCG